MQKELRARIQEILVELGDEKCDSRNVYERVAALQKRIWLAIDSCFAGSND